MTERVFIGRDNLTRRIITAMPALSQDQIDAINRVTVDVAGVTLDTNGGQNIARDGTQIEMSLGHVITEPGYYSAYVTIYSADAQDGKAAGRFGVQAVDWGPWDGE